jgi:hypothetical protein
MDDHLTTGIPELVVIVLLVLLIIGGWRRRPGPPRNHPIPANDAFLLNRHRERPESVVLRLRWIIAVLGDRLNKAAKTRAES